MSEHPTVPRRAPMRTLADFDCEHSWIWPTGWEQETAASPVPEPEPPRVRCLAAAPGSARSRAMRRSMAEMAELAERVQRCMPPPHVLEAAQRASRLVERHPFFR